MERNKLLHVGQIVRVKTYEQMKKEFKKVTKRKSIVLPDGYYFHAFQSEYSGAIARIGGIGEDTISLTFLSCGDWEMWCWTPHMVEPVTPEEEEKWKDATPPKWDKRNEFFTPPVADYYLTQTGYVLTPDELVRTWDIINGEKLSPWAIAIKIQATELTKKEKEVKANGNI